MARQFKVVTVINLNSKGKWKFLLALMNFGQICYFYLEFLSEFC